MTVLWFLLGKCAIVEEAEEALARASADPATAKGTLRSGLDPTHKKAVAGTAALHPGTPRTGISTW